MKATLTSLALLLLSGSGLAEAARQPMMVLEGSIETTAGQVILPSSSSGTALVYPCSGCAAQSLYLDANLALYLNGDSVTLATMSAALAASPGTQVTVHYRLADSRLTRLILVTGNP